MLDEPESDVIYFRVGYKNAAGVVAKWYEYAALRVNDRWYTTGSTCPEHGYTWPELRDELLSKSTSTGYMEMVNGDWKTVPR